MNFIQKLQYLPFTDLLLIVGLVLLLLVVIRFRLRRRARVETTLAETPPRAGLRLRRGLGYGLKLVGFALLSFIIIGGSVLVYEDYRAVTTEIAPAHHAVEIPDDLPFPIEEVTFTGGDDLTLVGWLVPPQNGVVIILLHGYSGDRTQMIWHAEVLTEAGYGVLMYDERASGESEGSYRSYGWEDAADVAGALAYLKSRPEINPNQIGIAGCSIGGQIALQGAAYYPQIGAVWADGPAVIRAVDNLPPHNWARAIAYIGNFIIDRMYTWRLNIQAPLPMIEIIDNIAPRPIMLVGGGTPRPYFGSEAPQVERYAAYAGNNATVWVIPEAHHCDGPVRQPEAYAARMVGFFDAAFDLE
ncbi:MAG: alpha/beta fold hydrolase [Anaerolineae bacterium]|nr:alpha/beta fold hydrolase [Anaerolineae bacterium]